MLVNGRLFGLDWETESPVFNDESRNLSLDHAIENEIVQERTAYTLISRDFGVLMQYCLSCSKLRLGEATGQHVESLVCL